MSDDGADMGVKPQRALETVLGGKEQPDEKEKMTPEQMHKELMDQPDNYQDIVGDEEQGYNNTSMWLAKQFLILLESGVDEDMDVLYDKMKEKNGDQDYNFTGFMVGWANNAARFALKRKSQPNPAIMTIKTK